MLESRPSSNDAFLALAWAKGRRIICALKQHALILIQRKAYDTTVFTDHAAKGLSQVRVRVFAQSLIDLALVQEPLGNLVLLLGRVEVEVWDLNIDLGRASKARGERGIDMLSRNRNEALKHGRLINVLFATMAYPIVGLVAFHGHNGRIGEDEIITAVGFIPDLVSGEGLQRRYAEIHVNEENSR